MKNMVKIVLFMTCSIFILSGCFSISTIIKVNKDGSGILEETLMMKKMNMFGSQSEGNSIYDEEQLKLDASKYGENVRFKSSKQIIDGDMQGYTVEYEFDDISKLLVDRDFSQKVVGSMPNMSNEEKIDETIKFKFSKGGTSKLTIILPKEKEVEMGNDISKEDYPEEDIEIEEPDEEMIEMMKTIYEDMRMSIKVVINGKIVDTNATYKDGSTITILDIDFEKLMKDSDNLKILAGMQQSNNKNMDKMMEQFSSVKVEENDEVFVKFK